MDLKWMMHIGIQIHKVSVQKTQEVMNKIEHIDMDMIVLTETKRRAWEQKKQDHIFRVLCQRIRGETQFLLVEKKSQRNIKSQEAVDERLIKVNIDSFRYEHV